MPRGRRAVGVFVRPTVCADGGLKSNVIEARKIGIRLRDLLIAAGDIHAFGLVDWPYDVVCDNKFCRLERVEEPLRAVAHIPKANVAVFVSKREGRDCRRCASPALPGEYERCGRRIVARGARSVDATGGKKAIARRKCALCAHSPASRVARRHDLSADARNRRRVDTAQKIQVYWPIGGVEKVDGDQFVGAEEENGVCAL